MISSITETERKSTSSEKRGLILNSRTIPVSKLSSAISIFFKERNIILLILIVNETY